MAGDPHGLALSASASFTVQYTVSYVLYAVVRAILRTVLLSIGNRRRVTSFVRLAAITTGFVRISANALQCSLFLFLLQQLTYYRSTSEMSLPEGLTSIIDEGLAFIYGLQPLVEPTVVLGKD